MPSSPGGVVSERAFLGIVTVPERADYLRQVEEGVSRHLLGLPDLVHVGTLVDDKHRGVAHTKNRLLRMALETGATYLFLSEDDIIVQSSEAITGYIAAAKTSGWEHLSFAHHGPANLKGPVDKDPTGATSYFPHYVGAWCLYSRRSIETCGFFDETFVNSWDHVEHTLRLSLAGFHPLPPEPYELRAADATGSENWLKEIPGSIENTSIPHTEQWKVDRALGRAYWKATYPDSYRLVFSR